MKKQDFLFIFVLVIIFLPFFVSEPVTIGISLSTLYMAW